MNGEGIMEITMTKVKPAGEIMIRTERSEYRFQVSNPATNTGFLTGGVLGQQRRLALLVGTIPREHGGVEVSARLETGTRALFFLAGKSAFECLTTSQIVALIYSREDTTAPCLAAA